MAQRTQTTESIRLQGCPDAEVKTANGEAFCATIRTLGFKARTRFSNFMKTQLQSPDARSQVRTLPREIRIYVELGFLKPI
jgi:hypothetical protein